jgi:hypothetical protein
VLRQTFFRWGEKELSAVKVNKLKSWWKAIVRGNAVSFDVIPFHNENDVLIGYEWRRCQLRIGATEDLRKLLRVALYPAILAYLGKPYLTRTTMMHAYCMALPSLAAINAITAVLASHILLVIWRILSGSRT